MGHVLLGYTENNAFGQYNELFLRLKDWIYIWHMPLFMGLSGFSFALAYYRNSQLDTVRVKKQILNLILLYMIFSILLYGLKIPLTMFTDNKMSLPDALVNLFFPNTIMWYLWVLAAYYLIFVCRLNLVNLIVTKPGTILGFLFAATVVQKISEITIRWWLCFGNFTRLAFYFCLGVVLCVYRDKKKLRKKVYVVAGTAIVALHFLYYMIKVGSFSVFELVSGAIVATLIVIFMFEIVSAYATQTFAMRLLAVLGKASLVIYLLHTYLVTAMKVVCIRVGLCSGLLMDILVVVLSTVIPITICYFVDFIRRNNRLVGTFFSPMKIVMKKSV